MNVLFVTHRYPPHTGGIETHVSELATRLAERGHEVAVFSADAEPAVPSRSVEEGVRVRRFRSISPGDAFYAAPQMTAAIRRSDADVVHAHNYHAFVLPFAALGVTGERFVATTHYHGASASRVRDALLSFYQPLGRRAVRRADAVVAVSSWERERVREDFGVDATVIPNGIDVERFRDAAPEERDRPYLLTVGRLEEYKGVQHAIRALSELPEYDLVIAGDGAYRERLEATARLCGVADHVSFLGRVPADRLPSLYASADAFVNLSSFEAYGMTVAEALTAGTPCVVREAGALRDWQDVRGVVGVAEPTPDRVQTACERAISGTSPDVQLPTWDDVTDRVLEVYHA